MLGDLQGVADLAEDLRLADDHAVDAAGDPEQMLHGVGVAELVEVG